MGGGGIVSPLYPWRYDAAVGALARWSQDFYPKLAHRLLATTEIDPEVHVTGLYWLDLQDELDALGWAGQGAYQVRRVALEMVREAVPPLGGGLPQLFIWRLLLMCEILVYSRLFVLR